MGRRLGLLLVLIQQGRAGGGDGEGGELPGLWETRIAQLCFRDHTAGPKVQAKDKFWTSLSEAERAAAGALGWSAGGWDDGDPGPLERKYWRVAQGQAEALSDAEKEHAELLGHSPRSWDHGMADNRLLSAVEGSLLEAVEQEPAGWGRPALRGLLTAPPPPQIEGLGEMRVWAEEALTHYLRAMHTGGGVTTVNVSDSWASVGRPENWAGAASQTLRSSDIVGHLFLSCPGPGGTCKVRRRRQHLLDVSHQPF